MTHLLGLVTLPVIFWGTISLLLTLGQNPDSQMIMSEAPRDAFAWGGPMFTADSIHRVRSFPKHLSIGYCRGQCPGPRIFREQAIPFKHLYCTAICA